MLHGVVWLLTILLAAVGGVEPTWTHDQTDIRQYNMYPFLKQLLGSRDPANFSRAQNSGVGASSLRQRRNLRFCGTQRYNSSEHICCRAQLLPRLLTSQICCGGVTIDSSEQGCCHGAVYNQAESGEKRACCGGIVISTKTQGCCNQTVYNLTRQDRGQIATFRCCGNQLMNSSEGTCVDDVIKGAHTGLSTTTTTTASVAGFSWLERWPEFRANDRYQTNSTWSTWNRGAKESWSDGSPGVIYTNALGIPYGVSIGVSVGCAAVLTAIGCFSVIFYRRICLSSKARHHHLTDLEKNNRWNSELCTANRHGDVSGSHSAFNISLPMSYDFDHGEGTNYLETTEDGNGEASYYPGTTDLNIGETNRFPENTDCNYGNSSRWPDITDDIETDGLSEISVAGRLSRASLEDVQHGAYPKDVSLTRVLGKGQDEYTLNNKNLLKGQIREDGNLMSKPFASIGTQTAPQKQYNRRNIFGRKFDHITSLDRHTRTMQMPNSDVKMSPPPSCLGPQPIEVLGSSFFDLKRLYRVLPLDKDEDLASPVVEYSLTSSESLGGHAVVEMPFIGSPAEVKVYKFKSTEGVKESVEAIQVPKRVADNVDQDLYHVVEGNQVYIYTRSFSGFYCTTNRHKRDLRLYVFIFGSFKRCIPDPYSVYLRMYIAEEILNLKDYRSPFLWTEDSQGRKLLIEEQLKIPDNLSENDVLVASMTPFHTDVWMHKVHPESGLPMQPKHKRVTLGQIVSPCPVCYGPHALQTGTPFCVSWYLTNKPGTTPTNKFQCVVDVDVRPEHSDEPADPSSLIIDEIELRASDKLPKEETDENVRIDKIKNFVSRSMPPEQGEKLLQNLRSKLGIKYPCATEHIFDRLRDFHKAEGVINVVVCSLNELHMYRELDQLIDEKAIPPDLVPKPVRNVSDNQHHENEASLTEQPINADVTPLNRSTMAAAMNYQLPPPVRGNGNYSQGERTQRTTVRRSGNLSDRNSAANRPDTEEGFEDEVFLLQAGCQEGASGNRRSVRRESSFVNVYKHLSPSTQERAEIEGARARDCRPELNPDIPFNEFDSNQEQFGYAPVERVPMLAEQGNIVDQTMMLQEQDSHFVQTPIEVEQECEREKHETALKEVYHQSDDENS